MQNITVSKKPLSVNEAWQGRRYKTPAYRSYEREMLLLLPKINLPSPPYRVYYDFGLSNSMSDWDNPVKPFQDICQKKYGFNYRDIKEAIVRKTRTKKGEEYISFRFETFPVDQ